MKWYYSNGSQHISLPPVYNTTDKDWISNKVSVTILWYLPNIYIYTYISLQSGEQIIIIRNDYKMDVTAKMLPGFSITILH